MSRTPDLSFQMQNKMVAYKHIVTELNAARLKGTSYPIVHSLIDASASASASASGVRGMPSFIASI